MTLHSSRVALLVAAILFAALPVYGEAGTQDQAVVAFHSTSVCKCLDICAVLGPRSPCNEYNTQRSIFSSTHAFFVVANADSSSGISSLSCGISVDPDVGIFGWTLCADADLPSAGWPATGTGNLISWDVDENCQRTVYGSYGVHAVAGSFYTYAYDDGSLTITPNSVVGETDFRVADCSGEESFLSAPGGSIGYGVTLGFNPCLSVVPVDETTWGQIKALGH